MTREEDEEQHRRNLEEIEKVHAYVRPRIERAERAYSQMLTSLWIGNAGAALATLTFIGGALQKGKFPNGLLLPLWLFVLGVISMGLGSAIALMKEAKALDRLQRATSYLDMRVDDTKTATELAGLTCDWRTMMAVLSAAFFVLGCFAGLFGLSFSN